MIRHVALFRFRPGLTAERTEAFHAAVVAMTSAVPVVKATAGPALRLQAGFDYALMLDLADAAAFAAYKAHPEHQRLIDEHIRPCVAETARIQVEV